MSSIKPVLFLAVFCCLATPLFSQSPPWAWAKEARSSATEWANDVAVDQNNGYVVAVGTFNSDLSAYYGPLFAGASGGGFVAKYDSAGNVIWAFPIGNNQDDACNSVAIAPSGNIYVTGYFQNVADFKGTLSGPTITMTSAGGKDVFLAKYNPAGQLQWARRAGGTNDDEGLSVCTNSTYIFICGFFKGSATFSGIPSVASSSNENLFAASYDTNGNIQWLTDGGAAQNCFARDIAADNNNVFVTGDFEGGLLSIYDYTGFNSANLVNSNASTSDIFAMSISVTGPFNWLRGISSGGYDFGRGIAQNINGIYLTGAISSGATFPSYSLNPVAPGAQGLDFFITRLNKTNGNTNWVNSEPGPLNEEGTSVCIDTLTGVCVSGYFSSTITMAGTNTLTSTGNEEVFMAQYFDNGIFNWVKQAGDVGVDIPYGIAAYTNGDIYLGGEYENSAAFGSIILSADGSKNIFVAKTGCAPIATNTISAAQTICAGQVPLSLSGSTPSGGSSPYTFLWQESPDASNWSAAGGTNNLQNYSPSALSANTYFRRIVFSGGVCTFSDTSANILITIDQPPTTSVAGNDSSVCTNSINLWGNTPTIGTGTWTLVSGTGSFGSVNTATTSFTGSVPGTYVLAWTIDNGVCAYSSDTVTVKIYAIPSTALAGPDQNICSSTYTLSANTPTVGTGLWSVTAGSATVLVTGNPNSPANGLGGGQNVFVWTISSGSCPSSSDTVRITVDALPSVSNAGSNQNICSASYTLSANNPVSGTGTWNVLSGGSSVSFPTQNNSPVTGLITGVNSLEWVISNGTCPPSRDTVQIIVDANPSAAVAGSDQTICTSSATLNANIPATGSGLWSVFSGGGSLTSPTTPNSGVSSLSTGQNAFIWTVSNGVCPPSKDTITVNVDALPTASTAGANQNICSSSYTLSANNPLIGTGNWNVLSGGSSVSFPTQNNSPVTGLTTGVNSLEWVISNGTCPPSRDTVQITVDAVPSVASAGSDQTICATTTSLSANNPGIGTGLWTVFVGAGSIVTTNAANTTVNGLSTGQNAFIWTISNGVCPPSKDTITVNVDALPTTSSAGTDQNICSSSYTLSANSPLIGAGNWNVLSGGSSVSFPTQNNSPVTGLTTGVNSLEWVISNGTCPPSRDTVQIIVDANPSVAVAGSDQTICAGSTTLNANNPVTGSGLWSVYSGGGSLLSPTSPTSAVNSLSIGQNTFIWTISNGVCLSSKDTVIINVDAMPTTANAGSNQTLCNDSILLNGNIPVTGTGNWSVITGGGALANPSQNITVAYNLATGTNVFMWTITNGVCPASSSTVSILVDAYPTVAAAGLDQSVCSTITNLNANLPSSGSGVWAVVSGPSTVTNPNQNNSAVTGMSVGLNIYEWIITNGTCPPSRDTIQITVFADPSPADAGTQQTICSSSTILNAVSPVTGTGNWSVLSGGAIVGNPAQNNSGVSGLTSGLNSFEWTVSNGVCTPTRDTVYIMVDVNPSASTAGADQIICSSSSSLIGNAPITGNGIWTSLGAAVVSTPTMALTGTSGLVTGQNIFIWTISNGVCPSSADTVVINVTAAPSTANAGTDQSICINSPQAILSAFLPITGTGMWAQVSGSGTIVNVNQNITSVGGLSSGVNILVWSVTNGVCPASSDTVMITVYPNPDVANAGPDIAFTGSTVTLSGNNPMQGTGNWALISGSGVVSTPGNAATIVTGLNFGDNIFGWTISNGVCPDSYDEVTIHVNDLAVPNGFSPNQDNVNDNFEIVGLDMFSASSLNVFNRWGNLIYENDNYKNDWGGKNMNGEDLSDDTYYFTLKIGGKKEYKGFVVLKRK